MKARVRSQGSLARKRSKHAREVGKPDTTKRDLTGVGMGRFSALPSTLASVLPAMACTIAWHTHIHPEDSEQDVEEEGEETPTAPHRTRERARERERDTHRERKRERERERERERR